VIKQSNHLVEARYALSLSEQRLILMLLAKIQADDTEFKEHRISILEFAQFTGMNKNHAYEQCKNIIPILAERILEIRDSDGVSHTIPWLSLAHYIAGEGSMKLCFDPLLKPYLLQLKSNFTTCKLDMLLSFTKQYSLRIYSLLKKYEPLTNYEIELEQLREMLGINSEQYTLYTNFKKDILITTQKELTEKADLYFDFEEVKYGRRVGAIRFHILPQALPNPFDKLKNSNQFTSSFANSYRFNTPLNGE
jgi:plasmid replication initiation protein